MDIDQYWAEKVNQFLETKEVIDGEQKRRERVCIAEIELDVPESMKRLISTKGIGRAIRDCGWVSKPVYNFPDYGKQRAFVPGPEVLARWREEDENQA